MFVCTQSNKQINIHMGYNCRVNASSEYVHGVEREKFKQLCSMKVHTLDIMYNSKTDKILPDDLLGSVFEVRNKHECLNRENASENKGT